MSPLLLPCSGPSSRGTNSGVRQAGSEHRSLNKLHAEIYYSVAGGGGDGRDKQGRTVTSGEKTAWHLNPKNEFDPVAARGHRRSKK